VTSRILARSEDATAGAPERRCGKNAEGGGGEIAAEGGRGRVHLRGRSRQPSRLAAGVEGVKGAGELDPLVNGAGIEEDSGGGRACRPRLAGAQRRQRRLRARGNLRR
jgi:hypothetical protein